MRALKIVTVILGLPFIAAGAVAFLFLVVLPYIVAVHPLVGHDYGGSGGPGLFHGWVYGSECAACASQQ